MAAQLYFTSSINPSLTKFRFPLPFLSPHSHSFTPRIFVGDEFGARLPPATSPTSRRKLTSSSVAVSAMFSHNSLLSDAIATGISGLVALSLLRLWEEIAKRGIFDQLMTIAMGVFEMSIFSDIWGTMVCGCAIFGFLGLWKETARRGLNQKLNRKLVHISIGLVFMLCWPLFSSGRQGAILASLIPGVNIIRMLVLGLGILKDEATVRSMSRYGDHRELLKGPLYYAATITSACVIYWRTSPIAIAAICNLCAGDGMADVIGRRIGGSKIPYNKNKTVAGSVAMFTAGFLASIGFMYYFSSFGYIQESWGMVLGFLVVSLASAVVESLPISTKLDDNLTVTLASIFVGSLVF